MVWSNTAGYMVILLVAWSSFAHADPVTRQDSFDKLVLPGEAGQAKCSSCCCCCRCDGHACKSSKRHCLWCPIVHLLDPDRDRVLPFLGNAARQAGYDIPLPFGVGGNIAYIDQGMDIERISLSVGGAPPFVLDEIPPFRIKSRDTNISTRLDLWILPFFNVYGIVGHTQGSAVGNVTVSGVPGLLPDTMIPIRIDYDGPTYGGGCTAAIGYENIFAVVDWNYTETDLDGIDSFISAQTAAPRVGLAFDKTAFWVGAFYTSVDKQLSSTVGVGGTPVTILIDLDVTTPWNFIYGARWAPCANLEFVVEHGFSGRNQIIGAAAVRF